MTADVGVGVVPGWMDACRDVDAVIVVDRSGGELDRNPRADALTGGLRLVELLTEESRRKLDRVIAAPRTGVELVTVGGAVLDVAAADGGGEAVLLVIRDVSRYAAAASKLAVVTDQLSHRNRDLSTLYEVSAQLSSTLNLAELGEATCQLIGEYLGAGTVAVEIGGNHYAWPGRAPDGPASGFLPLTMAHAEAGVLRWWRERDLDASERRLTSLIAGRAAVGFDNAILHASSERQADHDALTGLLNRSGLTRLLPTVAYPAAVVLLDLDHFKRINDRYGHDTGDHVLARVAETFRVMRSSEIPARWGGEEFVLVLPATTIDDAVIAMDRVRRRISSAIRIEGEPVTFSAGVASLGSPEAFERAVAAADDALYRAKAAGRDRVEPASSASLLHAPTLRRRPQQQGLRCGSKRLAQIAGGPDLRGVTGSVATLSTSEGAAMDSDASQGNEGQGNEGQGNDEAPGIFDHLPVVPAADGTRPGTVELGAFSVSLNVADLDASREFYEKLGFVVTGGDADQGWLILLNGESVLGLFHGMFDRNILTFNPGLTNRMERLASFTDVRDIQAQLETAGLTLETQVESGTTGAGSITLIDPDGNPVLIDQFF